MAQCMNPRPQTPGLPAPESCAWVFAQTLTLASAGSPSPSASRRAAQGCLQRLANRRPQFINKLFVNTNN